MEIAEKPPLTTPPPIPDRGDNSNARFLMIVPYDIKKEVEVLECCPKGEEWCYTGCNAAESFRRVWEHQGMKILGCQINHIACGCGKNCLGSMWGIVIPKRAKELDALIMYAILAGAISLEQTDDPTIKENVFTVEYRNEFA